MRAPLQRCVINRLIGTDGKKITEADRDYISFRRSGRAARKFQYFSQENIKCAQARSMKGVSTRFLTMDALEADSQALEASRQTGQGREARK
jgi:hypothetical protein